MTNLDSWSRVKPMIDGALSTCPISHTHHHIGVNCFSMTQGQITNPSLFDCFQMEIVTPIGQTTKLRLPVTNVVNNTLGSIPWRVTCEKAVVFRLNSVAASAIDVSGAGTTYCATRVPSMASPTSSEAAGFCCVPTDDFNTCIVHTSDLSLSK